MIHLFRIKNLIKILPEFLRLKVLRRNLVIPRLQPNEIIFKLATSASELEAAYGLLYKSYVSEGYMQPVQSGLRCTIFHTMPLSAVLIAVKNNEVIATVTLIKDSPLGLPSDKEYFQENESYRDKGYRLCEVSALAIDPKYRSGLVTFQLIKYLWHYSTDILEVNLLCCIINPKALDFYKAFLGFRQNGAEISYDFVEGAKGVHITRDLTIHKAWLKKVFNQKPLRSNLYKFFYEEKSSFIFPEKSSIHLVDPIFNKEIFIKLFSEKTDVLQMAKSSELALVKSAYSLYFDFSITSNLKNNNDPDDEYSHRPFRYPSAIPALLYNQHFSVMGQITDLGTHGIFFHTTAIFNINQKYEIIFKAEDEILVLEVEPRWKAPSSNKRHVAGYGLRFIKTPERLHSILRRLHELKRTSSSSEKE